MSTRTWASDAQTLVIAEQCYNQRLDPKSLLKPFKYIVNLDNVQVNMDYRRVEAMVYVLEQVEKHTPTRQTTL